MRRSARSLPVEQSAELATRFARSAAATSGRWMSTEEFLEWFERARPRRFRVDRIAFDELDGWSFDAGTGNLTPAGRRFFSVEGLRVGAGFRGWEQPILVQPQVGVIGLVAREFGGVLHFLVQARPEPGNDGVPQLSPTVQAVPGYGAGPRADTAGYLDYFRGRRRVRVLAESMQPPHGAWLCGRPNRTVIVEAFDDVPVGDGFCWLTLGQLGELLRLDHVLNSHLRTVLACAPLPAPGPAAGPVPGPADGRGHSPELALHPDVRLLAWLSAERARRSVRVRRTRLHGLRDWVRGDYSIDHVHGTHFRIMAVAVTAGDHEVPNWTQPLVEPVRPALAAFLMGRFHGTPHLLAHARVESGSTGAVQLGPTVQYAPGPASQGPPFADIVTAAAGGSGPAKVRFDATLSEEGDRAFRARTRSLVVEVDAGQVPTEPPPGYRWITPAQLSTLTRLGPDVNVQARTLLAAITSGAVRL